MDMAKGSNMEGFFIWEYFLNSHNPKIRKMEKKKNLVLWISIA